MEGKIKKSNVRKNIVDILQRRESSIEGSKDVNRQRQFSHDLIRRLGIEYELQGHEGPVNCLQWTPDGSLLVSGSDDTEVMIWDPMKHKRLQTLSTNHIGKIFSIKFLGANNNIIVTAASDKKVNVQSIEGNSLLDCTCHKSVVRSLASSPMNPTVFWSAGDDGRIMQYDLREPHECDSDNANLLIAYLMITEIKCIAVNPTKPHYLAVGVNDNFVRIYDRRHLKTYPLSKITDHQFVYNPKSGLNEINKYAQYYAPGHLALNNVIGKYEANYITFNSAGSEMLVNIAGETGEQIYLFDVNKERQISEIQIPNLKNSMRELEGKKCECTLDDYDNCYLPSNYDLTKPIKIPTELCTCFYMRRAFHLYRRRWVGDLYGAARDYLSVIEKWPKETKAFNGLIKCLLALGWVREAKLWYEHFCEIVPEFANDEKAKKIYSGIESPEKRTIEIPNRSKFSFASVTAFEIENEKRLSARDYELRFMGHCNRNIHRMEANFLGEDGNFICGGSSDGIIFLWERKTQSIVNALAGDIQPVNCLQPHPSTCLLASSGKNSVVKLWSPMAEDGTENIHMAEVLGAAVRLNQQLLLVNPVERLVRRFTLFSTCMHNTVSQ
ncbi:WD and tetratricopeptide repeats protein 1-like [Euwallacea fornicatus]|uniref:WD and tetratricopeptide repeats protein 1-like n=1 Tax=Euwallacea fornicatus TaxID=995702 RepID=UPI00339022C8